MQNPCDKCKKKDDCKARCFPKKDYDRAMKKRSSYDSKRYRYLP